MSLTNVINISKFYAVRKTIFFLIQYETKQNYNDINFKQVIFNRHKKSVLLKIHSNCNYPGWQGKLLLLFL